MRFSKSFSVLLPFLALGANAQTTNSAARSVSMDDCIQQALKNNLDLQIERYNPEISKFTLDASFGYYDPVFTGQIGHDNVTREAGGFNKDTGLPFSSNATYTDSVSTGLKGVTPIGTRISIAGNFHNTESVHGGSKTNFNDGLAILSVTQPLLKDFWIDQGRTTIKINKQNLRISEHGLQFLVMDVVTKVEQSYYDLVFTRENVRVQEKSLEVNQQFFNETKRKVEVGTLAPLEEKLAESQVAKIKADLILARNAVSVKQNVLKSLIGDNFAGWHGVALEPADKLSVEPAVYNLEDSWEKGISQRPDLAQLKLEVEKNDILLKYDYNQLFPSLDLFGTYGRNGLAQNSPGVFDDWRRENSPQDSYGIILTVPLSRIRERNTYTATKELKAQSILRLKKLEESILVQIHDAINAAKTAYERVGATRQATVYAQAAFDAEQKKLAAGTSTSFVVLQLQSALTLAQSAEIQAIVDYNKSLAALAFADGTALERAKLLVKVK